MRGLFLCPIWEKSNFPLQIKLLNKGEHIWSGFLVSEAHCNTSCPQNICQESSSFGIVMRELWKRQGFLFIVQHKWGLCSLTEWIILALSMLQASCFVSFVRLLSIIALALLCATFPYLWKEHLFIWNHAFPEMRILEWVSSYWNPLDRGFGRGVTALAWLDESHLVKKTRIAFHSKPPLGLVFLQWVEFISRKLQASCFVWIVRLTWDDIHPSITMCCFATFGKRATFLSESGLSIKGSMLVVGFRLL